MTQDSTKILKSPEELKKLIFENKFDKNLVYLAKAIKDRNAIKYDTVAVIDGEEGGGKSTLAIILGYLTDEKFNLDKNIAYLPTTNEVEDKFTDLDSKQMLIIDEAIKAFYKLRFMDKMQTRVNTMYATERKQRKNTLLCIPRFTDLNEFFRNDRVNFWIHVVSRGVAVVFVKDKLNLFGSDRWHMAEEYKRIMSTTFKTRFCDITPEDALKIYQKSKLFWFSFAFPQLPEEVEDEYLRLREEYNLLPAAKTLESDERKRHVLNLIKLNKERNLGLMQKDIASMAGMSEGSLSVFITKYVTPFEK